MRTSSEQPLEGRNILQGVVSITQEILLDTGKTSQLAEKVPDE